MIYKKKKIITLIFEQSIQLYSFLKNTGERLTIDSEYNMRYLKSEWFYAINFEKNNDLVHPGIYRYISLRIRK